MEISDAVTALRSLDALPEARRRYLSTVAATAPTDADRARIVALAKRENIDKRWSTEQALKAELDARRTAIPKTPLQASQPMPKASPRVVRTDETAPKPRPVSVRFIEPTKVAKAGPVRAEGMGKKKTYKEPEPVPTERPFKHGTSTGYNQFACRCEKCRTAKAVSRKNRGLRRPAGEIPPHGTLSRYSNHKCRCDECRSGATEWARQKRAQKRKA